MFKDNQDYDVETGLSMVGQRYYSPDLCRFIQPADVSSLNPRSINGLNLYAYANNNPVGIAYSGSSAAFGATGGMVSSLALGGLTSVGGHLSGSARFVYKISISKLGFIRDRLNCKYGGSIQCA
ncbi:MAG: RHS repeat-associated core domain-containing protein [Bacilli bacterium]